MRDLQEQVEKSATKNCSDLSQFEKIVPRDLKIFKPSASNFKSFSRSLNRTIFSHSSRSEQFW